ncbi:hypothetical protein AGDE_12880 [Angomonas deanei]|nr:hypothetical protein AGDE_12880 [Angomonas deanei]|eukprot:EPY23347.1 hypothetical protein AGDE_12880 [Angomonas deanei]
MSPYNRYDPLSSTNTTEPLSTESSVERVGVTYHSSPPVKRECYQVAFFPRKKTVRKEVGYPQTKVKGNRSSPQQPFSPYYPTPQQQNGGIHERFPHPRVSSKSINREPVGFSCNRQYLCEHSNERQTTSTAAPNLGAPVLKRRACEYPSTGRAALQTTLTHVVDRVRLADTYRKRWESSDKQLRTAQNSAVLDVRKKFFRVY